MQLHQLRRKLPRSTRGLLLCLLLSLSALEASAAQPAATIQDEVWLLVDTRELVLTVMRDNKPVKSYPNLSIGMNGASLGRRSGDEKTPLGTYLIDEIRPSARFKTFISIDYPGTEDADRALRTRSISSDEYAAIHRAHRAGTKPPQNTILGGHIGIHGLGSGNAEVHSQFNWTNGCIALTDDQVDQLVTQINIGTKVRIK